MENRSSLRYHPAPLVPSMLPSDDPQRVAPPPPYRQPARVEISKSLREGLDVLRKGKWLILFSLALVIAGMTAYTAVRSPEYVAYSLIMVDFEEGAPNADVLNMGTLGGAGYTVRNQTLVLQQSLYIAQRTLERLLDSQYTQDNNESPSILNVGKDSLSLLELAAHIQEQYIHIRPEGDRMSGAIRITAASPSAAEAALLANIYAEEFVTLSRETSLQRITASRLFLEEQIAKRRQELRSLEDQMTQHLSRQENTPVDQGVPFFATQIALLEGQLDEERIEKSIREASLRSLEETLQQIRPRLVQQLASRVDDEIQEKQTRLAELELAVDQIYLHNPELRNNPSRSEELTSLNTQIAALKDRILELSRQYVDEMMAAGGSVPTTETESIAQIAQLNRKIIDERLILGGVTAKIAALEQRLATYRAKLRAAPGQSIQHAQLERLHQSTEQLYISLLDKLEEVRIAGESEVSFVRIIRPALIPDQPTGLGDKKSLALGTLLGLLLGVVAAVARYWLDTRINAPADLQERGIMTLGVIPDMRGTVRDLRTPRVVEFGTSKVSVHPTLPSLLEPSSPIAEAYRHLYMMLKFSFLDQVIQTVLVTSSEAGVGKSTTALNLAITTAQANRRTLIVDADLRRPALHTFLEFTPGPGLKELLSENKTTWDAERFATGIANLYAIPVHAPLDNTMNMLESARLHRLIEQFKNNFDIIIFDSPPALVVTDAMPLAAQCDATLVVVSAGRTNADALEQTLADLHHAGASVVGAVLNRFTPSPMYKNTYGYRQKKYYDVARLPA